MKLELILKSSEVEHIIKHIPYKCFVKKEADFFRICFPVKEKKEIDPILRFVDQRLRKEDQVLNTAIIPELSSITLSCGFKVTFVESSNRKQSKKREILLKRGLAFGGFHPTTVMCLELIEKAIKKKHPNRILDLGTGSGILSIMAEKLGAKDVYAVDIDFNSCLECRENIRLNACSRIKVICGTEASVKGKFDFIMVNIIFHTLKEILARINEMLEDNGILIISGFLASNTVEFIRLLGSGILLDKMEKEGWGAILWQKKRVMSPF